MEVKTCIFEDEGRVWFSLLCGNINLINYARKRTDLKDFERKKKRITNPGAFPEYPQQSVKIK